MSSRRWCITINNYTEEDQKQLEDLENKTSYLVVGREIGAEGTKHLQCFCIMSNNTRMAAMSKLLTRAHLEAAKGTSKQASDYCKKEGDFYERGSLPKDTKAQAEDQKAVWREARLAAEEGRFKDIPDQIYVNNLNAFHRIYQMHQVVPESIPTLDFWWYYGPTGTGKSYTARTENPDYYVKGLNKWWDGYEDQPCVIIEEWHPEVVDALQQMLKQWCDHHPFAAETKGSTRCIRPGKIIITSNYSMEECFKDLNVLDPLKRRIKVKHFSQLNATIIAKPTIQIQS